MSAQLSFLGDQFTNIGKAIPTDGPDPRHVEIREFIKATQRSVGMREQWDPRSARALSNWLKANPGITIEDAKTLIVNRFASDEPVGSPPFDWLPRLTKYWQGALDRYGKVMKPDWRLNY